MMAEPAKLWHGDAILRALPEKGACLTIAEIAAATGVEADKIANLFTRLNASGFVGQARQGCYFRTKSGDALVAAGRKYKSGPHRAHGKPRVVDGLKDKIWAALRMQRRATIEQLLEVITHSLKHPEDVANRYLLLLRNAGVTVVSKRRTGGTAETSNGFLQHVLVHDLGPKAPINRDGRLWDPNKQIWVDELLAAAPTDGEAAHG